MKLSLCRSGRVWLSVGCLSLATVLSGTAWAAGAATPASGEDRLFQSFAEDAAIIPNQWWEGSFEFTNYNSDFDTTALMLTAAFRPVDRLEAGGRVGFGKSSSEGGPDGSGATDFDLWAKYHVGTGGGRADFVVGGLATIPTGDDTAGLGHDAFDFEGFGAMRYRMPEAILTAHLGFRMNGDGHIQGIDLDGKTSAVLGVGVIFPVSDRVGLVGEANVESERWRQQSDSDFRILAGVNWRPLNRGIVRAAVSAGLTDGAPDGRLTAGYAFTF